MANYAGDHRNMIILTGFQSPGTRGATLASGKTSVRIHGQAVAVRAEVAQLASASAHADGNELMAWLRRMPEPPRQVYVVHGEREASDMLRQRIEQELHWRAVTPEHNATWPG
jgi:metallo-beta-lactamase family protein